MISKKKRFEVLTKYGFACKYCGKKPPYTILEVDHVISKSDGGTDDISNLVSACFDCNRGKGSGSMAEGILKDAKKTLYKRKIDDTCRRLKQYFYERRNFHKMGMLNRNETILLSFYTDREIKGEDKNNYCGYVDLPSLYEKGSPYGEDRRIVDAGKQCELFEEGGSFCDEVLDIMLKDGKFMVDTIIEEVYDDDHRNWITEDGPDYSGKLNYELTEKLSELGYIIKKYTLYPKLLENV